MPRSIVAVVTVGILLASALRGTAQTTRSGEQERAKREKAQHLEPAAREPGDTVLTSLEHLFRPDPPAVRPTFGGVRPGAGLALGVASAVPAGERGLWRASAAMSVNRFKAVSSALEMPPWSTDCVHVGVGARWEDAPVLRFFGLGSHTLDVDQATYGLRTTEASGTIRVTGPWRLTYGADTGATGAQFTSAAGHEAFPGVSTALSWWRTGAFAEADTRQSPGYTTRGSLARVALHRYAGLDFAPSFTRSDIDLRHFTPIVQENWVVALQARADLTAGAIAPFFMLPSIGGRDTLAGFDNDRFTDRNALMLRGELRWAAAPVVDMALFLDTGTVAPTVGRLNLHDLHRSWGVGARLHGDSYTALRLQVAHSPEGWRYNVAQGVSF